MSSKKTAKKTSAPKTTKPDGGVTKVVWTSEQWKEFALVVQKYAPEGIDAIAKEAGLTVKTAYARINTLRVQAAKGKFTLPKIKRRERFPAADVKEIFS